MPEIIICHFIGFSFDCSHLCFWRWCMLHMPTHVVHFRIINFCDRNKSAEFSAPINHWQKQSFHCLSLHRLISCHNSVNHSLSNYANGFNFTETQRHVLTAHSQVRFSAQSPLWSTPKPPFQGRVNSGTLSGSWLCRGTWTLSRVRDAAQWQQQWDCLLSQTWHLTVREPKPWWCCVIPTAVKLLWWVRTFTPHRSHCSHTHTHTVQ